MTYRIDISDEQRLALIESIKASEADKLGAPLEYWLFLLAKLPEVEKEYPGTLHGFCIYGQQLPKLPSGRQI